MVHGRTDRHGAEVTDGAVSPADLTATIFHLLGVDPRLEIHDRLGRPLTLCDGQVIEAIL